MPYAPAKLVLRAAKEFEGTHALAAVTLLTLLREGVRQGVDVTVTPVEYGSTEEKAYLNDFFRLAGAPDPEWPYRALWSETHPWQDEKKFAGGGLQRQRAHAVGKGEVLVQNKVAGSRDTWRLTPTAGAELLERSRKVRIVDLALWLGREIDTATLGAGVVAGLPAMADDLDRLVAWFVSEFGPSRGDLIGTVLDDAIPADYRDVAFADAPIGDETYEALGVLPSAPALQDDLNKIVQDLESFITGEGYTLSTGMVRRVLTAWLRGDIVVLVGQPGTGKSLFAQLLGQAMRDQFDLDPPLVIPIRADFDEAEFVGYERLDGTVHLQDFAKQVLTTDAPLEARVVILEEFNLAAIETYMASVLVATQDESRAIQLPGGTGATLPTDTFIIATCNSFRDEPETRTRVSSPTKRRSTTITMPNVLGDRYEADATDAVSGLLDELIANQRSRVQRRVQAGVSAQFDSLRLEALESVTTSADLSPEVVDALTEVSNAILGTTHGRSWFTIGILKDVVMGVVMAARDADSELTALGQSVADKLVHQLRGTHAEAQDLLAVIAALPGADEIGRLIEQTMTGPSEELLPLL